MTTCRFNDVSASFHWRGDRRTARGHG